MRQLSCLGLAALIACDTSDTDDTGSCGVSTGHLSGQVFFGDAINPGSAAGLADVQAWDESAGESQDDALLISSDEDGVYAVDLPVATWTVAAISDDSMSFTSTTTTVTIEACGDTTLDLYLDDGFG
jgi:hypothetical protein